MIRLRPPTEIELAHVAETVASASPTHPADGAFTPFSYQEPVGRGRDDFDAGRSLIRNWTMHDAAGVHASPVPMAVGNDVVMWTRAVGITLVFACRIMDVVDDDRTFAFTYATLPGHPAQGVETFRLELDDNEVVQFHIDGESRPELWLHKLSGPIGLRLQRQATERYITALRSGIATVS